MQLRDLALSGMALALTGFTAAGLSGSGGNGGDPPPVPPVTRMVSPETRILARPVPTGGTADLPDSVARILVASGYADIVVPGDPRVDLPPSVAAVLAARGIAITVPEADPDAGAPR